MQIAERSLAVFTATDYTVYDLKWWVTGHTI